MSKDIVAGIPIAGFTGINGAGKTLLAVTSAIHDMAGGRQGYSTVPISHGGVSSFPVESMRQLLELRDCTVLLDDISVIFSSRTTNGLPSEVVAWLHTLRHKKITLRWTAPQWMRADTNIRGVTQALVNVVPLIRGRGKDTPWPAARLVLAGVLDTSTGKADGQPEGVMRRRLLIPRSLEGFGAYDTEADTPMLANSGITGVCPDCGGSRERPKHTEARHIELGLAWP